MKNALNWLIPLLIALGSLVVSGYTSYSHQQEHANTRISVIESKQEDDRRENDRRLGNIERKVDELVTWTRNR